MSETITQTRIEDAIASTNTFLESERGASIDGAFASQRIKERIESISDRAEALLQSISHPKLSGLYVPLSKYNVSQYAEAATVLPGYLVLIPSSLVDKGTSAFYPAVVSEDGLKKNNLRLHVLRHSYHRQIQYGTSMILSAAGQSETKGIGEHGRKNSDGIEAEHFVTLLAAASDPEVQNAWQAGHHANHTWREQNKNSVTSEANRRLFGPGIPQTTITITKQQIETGQAMLLWHEGMKDHQTGKPETASKEKALVIIQGLGYEALRNSSPKSIDNIKSLIS